MRLSTSCTSLSLRDLPIATTLYCVWMVCLYMGQEQDELLLHAVAASARRSFCCVLGMQPALWLLDRASYALRALTSQEEAGCATAQQQAY